MLQVASPSQHTHFGFGFCARWEAESAEANEPRQNFLLEPAVVVGVCNGATSTRLRKRIAWAANHSDYHSI